jgi:leader peptidase (prepilin peptidase)/N-methyltransferase
MVELLTAVLFGLAWWRFGWSWTLVEALVFIFSLVVVSFIDLDHMILPDKFTLSGIVIGLVGGLLNPERDFLESVLGVVFGGGFLWAVAYLYFVLRKREGMGGGDIKLLAWIGAVLGWKAIPFVILVASVFGSVAGVGLILAKKNGGSPREPTGAIETSETSVEDEIPPFAIPFGPFLASAALVYLLIDGEAVLNWYFSLHGL